MNERAMFAITAVMFSAIFLVSTIVYGGDMARNVAIGSAFLGTVSQYAGPDPASFRLSIYAAYGAFMTGLFAFFCLIAGA